MLAELSKTEQQHLIALNDLQSNQDNDFTALMNQLTLCQDKMKEQTNRNAEQISDLTNKHGNTITDLE